MQDKYVGDVGDYGKFGLLRTICNHNLSLAVNWYRSIPSKVEKQDDGKFVSYLSNPDEYREHDPFLFDALSTLILVHQKRSLEAIESMNLFPASYFSEPLSKDRSLWHKHALQHTSTSDVVFLDPDNGLETRKMFLTGSATEKHVKYTELKDYYTRGQSVVLYQHRPQMMKKSSCIESVMSYQKEYLKADMVKILEFPRFTNRFYFIFLQNRHQSYFESICSEMVAHWGKNNFCRELIS